MEANQVDRISSLPEQLTYHILSFMDMKQVVRLSCVSSRWEKLWASTPYLNFNEDSWPLCVIATKKISGTHKMTGKIYKFKEFINRVLLNRDASDILTLSVSVSTSKENLTIFEIDRWTSYALQRRVHELVLKGSYIPFPKCLCFASTVKVVQLCGVFLLCQKPGELALNLKAVETLIMENCNHDNGELKMLTISAPKLYCLQMEYGKYTGYCTVKVCAPNLKLFKFKGPMYKNYVLEKLSSLATADVDTSHTSNHLSVKVIQMFLKEFVHADFLTVTQYGFQISKKSQNMLEEEQIAFENIKYLKIIDLHKNSRIQPVVTFLQGFGGLETLVLQTTQGGYAKGNSWEGQYSFECRLYRLKSIEYQEIDRCEDELKFMTFMLKNALMLEQISIASTTHSNSKKKKLVKFCQNLQSIPIVSSSVTIMLNLPRRDAGPYYLVLQNTNPCLSFLKSTSSNLVGAD